MTTTQINHKCTYIASLLSSPPLLPPHPIPLGHHRLPGWSPVLLLAASSLAIYLLMILYICQYYFLPVPPSPSPLCHKSWRMRMDYCKLKWWLQLQLLYQMCFLTSVSIPFGMQIIILQMSFSPYPFIPEATCFQLPRPGIYLHCSILTIYQVSRPSIQKLVFRNLNDIMLIDRRS